MKLFLITILSFVFLFSSCTTIYFDQPQPKWAERLTEVPSELHGQWLKKSEGYKIDVNGITTIDIKSNAKGNPVDTVYSESNLSDSLRLYKAKKYYVLNSNSEDDQWEILVLEPLKNGDINVYRTIDLNIFNNDRGLRFEKAIIKKDGKETTIKDLDSEFDTTSDLKNAYYSGQMKMKTIHKIATQDNLLLTFKSDGSVDIPEESDLK